LQISVVRWFDRIGFAFIRNIFLGRARADWPEMIYNREMIFPPPCRFPKPVRTEEGGGEMPRFSNFKAASSGFFGAVCGQWISGNFVHQNFPVSFSNHLTIEDTNAHGPRWTPGHFRGAAARADANAPAVGGLRWRRTKIGSGGRGLQFFHLGAQRGGLFSSCAFRCFRCSRPKIAWCSRRSMVVCVLFGEVI
jgi:hypothetical protein